MAFNSYQVIYNSDGTLDSIVQLPTEPEKKRVIVVRASNEVRAEIAAKLLYSLAK